MKQFIYLDTDIVNSIIAQNQKGLITQQTLSNQNTNNQSEDSSIEMSAELKVGGNFMKLVEAVGNLGLNRTTNKGQSSATATSDVIEKVLHDAAFDVAYEYIKPFEVLVGKQDYDGEGNYLSIKRVFDFIDFDYLESLFSNNGLIEYVKKSNEETIKNEFEKENNFNREQNRNNKSIKKELQKIIDAANKEYDDAGEAIGIFRSILPYNRMLFSNDGYLVPLDEQYFRINPKNLGFKYGGEITCVGMVTNIIGEDTDPNDDNNIFATIQYTASEALRSILPTKENNICVIHPIAIYYGD